MKLAFVNKNRQANEEMAEAFIKKFYEKEEIRIQKKIMKEHLKKLQQKPKK
jgi:exosome complex RNA-binding protein Rrp4